MHFWIFCLGIVFCLNLFLNEIYIDFVAYMLDIFSYFVYFYDIFYICIYICWYLSICVKLLINEVRIIPIPVWITANICDMHFRNDIRVSTSMVYFATFQVNGFQSCTRACTLYYWTSLYGVDLCMVKSIRTDVYLTNFGSVTYLGE